MLLIGFKNDLTTELFTRSKKDLIQEMKVLDWFQVSY